MTRPTMSHSGEVAYLRSIHQPTSAGTKSMEGIASARPMVAVAVRQLGPLLLPFSLFVGITLLSNRTVRIAIAAISAAPPCHQVNHRGGTVIGLLSLSAGAGCVLVSGCGG